MLLENGALLEVVYAIDEVVELLAEKIDEGPAMLEAPVPVDMVVLLPIVKTAELDELSTEEVVMVLLLEREAAELEEPKADEVVIPADAVGPEVLVALPVGNMAEVLEREEPVELPKVVVLLPDPDGNELAELTTEEVVELEKDEIEEPTTMDDETIALDESDALDEAIDAVADDEDAPAEEDVMLAEVGAADEEAEDEVMVAVTLY